MTKDSGAGQWRVMVARDGAMSPGPDRDAGAAAVGGTAVGGTAGSGTDVDSASDLDSASDADSSSNADGGDARAAAATAAFTQLFRTHHTALYGYLLGRTGQVGSAEELTQELFLRAWRHLPELTGRSTEGQRAWLFTVARNLAVDELRQRRTRNATLTAVRAEPTQHAPAASAAVRAADDVQRVGAAIAGLPDDLRTVLSLATAGGLSSPDIAALLGIPAGTVRYRLSRARAMLADVLAEPPNREDRP